METDQYQKMASRELNNFWYVGRREIMNDKLLRFLNRKTENKILDVGCGTGGNIFLLEKFGKVVGVDISPEAINSSQKYAFDRVIHIDITATSFPGEEYDLVTALDVLEHIREDERAIQKIFKVLKKGGLFLLTVPAYKFLWSSHDNAMGHVRRYSLKEIVGKIEDAGFEIVDRNRFVMLGVPMRFLNKIFKFLLNKSESSRKDNKIDFSKTVNGILLLVLRMEKFIIRHFRIPFGTSILVVAKKPIVYEEKTK